MTLNLYVNTSEREKLEKTLENAVVLQGTLRAECDVLNPVIMIESSSDIVLGKNYAYIPDFNRYFFITDIECVRQNLFRISMRVDVLMSFATQIKEQTAIIQRQENNWNLYINDGFFRVQQNPKIQIKAFPNGFDISNYSWYLITTAG